MRPLKGQLGNAPRTLDVRGPIERYVDLSFQKNFALGASSRRIQVRVDMINAFNHPNFRLQSGNSGTDLFGALPSETVITAAEYDAWARFNNKPSSTSPQGQALIAQIQQIVIGSRLPSGALPVDFFHVRVPQGFATTNSNSFDITTADGYKLYRSRQAYGAGFGQLFGVPNPRYIQIGLKIFF
jgi:hypothetical protein